MANFGPYELIRRLGAGGMGEAFLANLKREESFQKLLVIKRILPHLSSRPSFRELFKREARLAAHLSHQNIVQIFDFGQFDDQAFIAMEFVDGIDCSTLLRQHGEPLPPDCVLRILIEATRGLEHAHRKRGPDGAPLGIVHRDVSPRNLLVSFEGEVKWIDFGLAAALEEGEDRVLAGTVPYMAPEQARGGRVDARSDLFSLAIVAYELFCGQRPFDSGNDPRRQVELVEANDYPEPSEACALPPEVDRFFRHALQPLPEQRFPSGVEMLEALEELTEHIPLAPPRELGELLTRSMPPEELEQRHQIIVERTAVGEDPIARREDVNTVRTLVGKEPIAEVSRDESFISTGPVAPPPPSDLPETRELGGAEPQRSSQEDVVTAILGDDEPETPSRRRWALAVLLTLALVGVGVVLMLSLRPAETTPEANGATAPSAAPRWRLVVDSQPSGAAVSLDGDVVGSTPLRLGGVEPGAYSRLSISAEGYQSHEETLNLGPSGGELQIQATLQPFQALLSLEVTPVGARVTLDGQTLEPPFAEITVDAGTSVVTVAHPNYQERTRVITLEAGERHLEVIALPPQPAQLRVETVPPSATVALRHPGDSVPLRPACVSPCVIDNLAPGAYAVTATASGYQPSEPLRVELQPAERGLITIELEDEPRRRDGTRARVRAVGGSLYYRGRKRSSATLRSGTVELRADGFKAVLRLEPTRDGAGVLVTVRPEPWARVVVNGETMKSAFIPLEPGSSEIRLLPQGRSSEQPLGFDLRVRE